MDNAKLSEHFEVDDFTLTGLDWKVTLAVLIMYLIKIVVSHIYFICRSWYEECASSMNLKYDQLIVRLGNLHLKIDILQKTSESHLEALTELKKRTDELRSDLNMVRSQMVALRCSAVPAANNATIPGGPPPPPPPPPPFSLLTPTLKIVPPSSSKTDMPKKKQPTGPQQFSISQADITKVLQKLRKTSSTARLMGSGTNPKKTPPRRKLFGRTPGHSRRRSITGLSPGVDHNRFKTPLSSLSPTHCDDADINGNGCDMRK